MPTSPPAAILIVNDRKADLVALAEALRPLGETVLTAGSAEEGLRLAEAHDIAVAIIDVRMPAIDGFGMLERLRRDPKRGDLPVIFVTAFDVTPEIMQRVYELGAADIVQAPAMPTMLRSKVAVFVKLHRQTVKERLYALDLSASAAAEVKEQQERFRLLMEATSDYALFFMDPLGLISEWTLSAERLLGYRARDVVGKHFRFLFTEEDRVRRKPEAELEMAGVNGQSNDDRMHVRRDGSLIPIAGRTIALKERDGTLRGFAKIMRDATRVLALRESEAKFREIFDTANEGIWILDPHTVIETANHRIAEILGYDVSELIGRRKSDFVFPEDQAYIAHLFEERRSGKIQPAVEVRFRRKDGTAIWTLLSARPIFRHGQFAGALDMFTDVTGRRLAEERFRVFFELSAAGYALIDPVSHRFLSVNRRFCEITGRDANQLVGLSFEDITHPEDRADDDERFGALFAGRVGEVSTEKRYLRPDGTVVWVHLTTSMVRDPTGKPELQISVVEDITARKKAEQEFEAELQRQITQRTRELDEKTKQLESFCYTVAHDLRAPLRAINGFADYAIEDIGSDHPQASGFLDRIRKSTTRLDALITDLLNYTRIDQLPVTHDRIDLRPVIDSALRDLDEEIRQSDAVIQVKEPLPAVIGEQSILEQMVLNLVSNAVKFHRPDEPPHVDIFARDGDGRVRLFVQDRGIGIPPEYHQRIFRVFERLQTSRGYPGTGMGLAIVARGAERLGGECGVESEPGKGSTFWIDLKRA